ncbi:MAG TPA: TA system VapC family ribonuclease toxin [Thermoanaerobaculia bacterium]|nr:TA system VapC family ribonuclease toxin [Thermoanaerobaculia bacterium]
MLAVDTNVLVYAHRREAREHVRAKLVIEELATARGLWGVPWPCVYEFYSIVTNRRIWKESASTQAQAWAQLDAWLESPSVRLIGEPPGFVDVLEVFVRRPRVLGPVVHDARVAAICVAHGISALLTRDRDFSLFPELETRNPFD